MWYLESFEVQADVRETERMSAVQEKPSGEFGFSGCLAERRDRIPADGFYGAILHTDDCDARLYNKAPEQVNEPSTWDYQTASAVLDLADRELAVRFLHFKDGC